MEGFELIATGLWSIVPPILALVLALITKEVYSSLTIGVFTGMIIYQFTLNGAGGEQLVASFTMVPQMMAEQIAGNGALLLFLALLGALTVVIATAGGSRAYAEWVTTHVKNARAASILTALLGIIIFVDDYFNCLTVGAVMRPVTDKFRVSHEKLAWIIDSTAAPVCIIAPVSSWAVAVGGYMGEDGFNTFVASSPTTSTRCSPSSSCSSCCSFRRTSALWPLRRTPRTAAFRLRARRWRRCPSPASLTRPRSIWKARRTFPRW